MPRTQQEYTFVLPLQLLTTACHDNDENDAVLDSRMELEWLSAKVKVIPLSPLVASVPFLFSLSVVLSICLRLHVNDLTTRKMSIDEEKEEVKIRQLLSNFSICSCEYCANPQSSDHPQSHAYMARDVSSAISSDQNEH